MRNLKKVLALVVAVAMIASMGLVASAASYSDVASNASYADAVNLLSNLGIINGYEDGTFRPDNTVTRAEAAAMIVRMLGLDDEVEQGETMFTDVKADDWASGYVNVAAANGIINGMGDGTFNPNGEVTYGQIVKMIVCALGYEPVAQAHGGYLGGGYLVAGSSQHAGFTKGIAGTQNAAASRATVARLIYNALEVELMDQTSFSTGINGSTYEVLEGKTVLSEYLELEKVDAVVTETYLSNVDYEEGANQVALVITKNYAEKSALDLEAGDEEYFVADGTDAATLLGYTVTAYVGDDEEDGLTIYAIAAKSGKNNVVVLDTELIESMDDTSIEYYKSESARSTTEAEIQAFVKVGRDEIEVENNLVVNGFNVGYELLDDFDYSVLDEITLLDNDNDGDFEFIFATMPAIATGNAYEFVVEEIDYEDWYIEGEEDDFSVDYDDADKLYTIVKDGKIVELDAVVAGDVVTILDDSVNVITIYVSSVVVEGTVDEVDDDVYTINGGEYEVSPISAAVVGEINAGDEGIFYVNASGKIAYVDAVSTVSGADYVYVIDADFSEGDFGDGEYLVKVVTAAGAVEILTIKSKKVTVDDETGLTDEEAFEAIEGYEGLAKIDTTASGELDAIYFPGSEDFEIEDNYAEANEKEYNEARGRYGVIDLTSDVLVFHKDTTEEDLEDAITVTTVGNLFVDGSSYVFTAYGTEDEVEVLVAIDAKASVDAEAPVMVVTKTATVTAEDEKTLKITGVVAGATVSVIVDPDEYEAGMVEKGNVILYAEGAEFVTDVQVLFASTADAPADAVTAGGDIVDVLSDEQVSIHYGAITDETEADSKSFVIDGQEFFYAEEYNVTVVDYSYNTVSIKAGKTNDLKYSTRNNKVVFVKTLADVEDEVSDVVVFITPLD